MRTHLDIKHTGTIEGDRTRMTFDPGSVAHLMSVLTDLYSDPEMAIVREYSTNALDSHRRAGVTKPVEVTTPTALHQYFSVTDFGEGMTREQIQTEYAMYGWSSNRDTDLTTGMLGLGCKSALSYTMQFTVYSRKDGIETLAIVTREEDGAGAIQVIAEEPTGEPNGTTIEIPVKNPNTCADKINRFFMYWDSGDVLVDGEVPDQVWDAPYLDAVEAVIWADATERTMSFKLDDDVVLSKLVPTGEFRLVMGGVAYPVNWDTLNFETGTSLHYMLRNWKLGIAVRVPIGSLDFVPSREALNYTKRSKDTVHTAIDFVCDRLADSVQKAVDAQPTHLDAWKLMNSLSIRYLIGDLKKSHGDFKYRSEAIPEQVNLDHVHRQVFSPKGDPVWEYADKVHDRQKWSLTAGNGYGPPTPSIKVAHFAPAIFDPTWYGTWGDWTKGNCQSFATPKSSDFTNCHIESLRQVGVVVTGVRIASLSQADKRKIRAYCEANALITQNVNHRGPVPVLNDVTQTSKRVNDTWVSVLLLPSDKVPKTDWWLRSGVAVVTLEEVRAIQLVDAANKVVVANTVPAVKAGALRTMGCLVDSHKAQIAEVPDDGSAHITAWVDSQLVNYNSNKRVDLENWLRDIGYEAYAKSTLSVPIANGSRRDPKINSSPENLTFVWLNTRERERFKKFYPNVPSIHEWLVEQQKTWSVMRPDTELLRSKVDMLSWVDRDEAKLKTSLDNRTANQILTAVRAWGLSNDNHFMDPEMRELLIAHRNLSSSWKNLPAMWTYANAGRYAIYLDSLYNILRETAIKYKQDVSTPAIDRIIELVASIATRYAFMIRSDAWNILNYSRYARGDGLELRDAMLMVEAMNAVYICREGLHLLPIS